MNSIMKQAACIALFLVLLVPFFVNAETVLRIGEKVSVDDDQSVGGDYYVSVGPLGDTSMSGTVGGDMYAFGGIVTVNGPIGADLTIVGGSSQVHATVTDDVRIVAGEVTIAEHVGGDLFVLGGKLQLLSSASVAGDVIFFGGEAELNGNIDGSVLGTSEKIRIDAEVKGDVDIKTATALTLGDKAHVVGSVRYSSMQDLVRSPNAIVDGSVIEGQYGESVQADAKDMLVPAFVMLFATFSLYLLFRKEVQSLAKTALASPLRSVLFGFAVCFLGPLVSALLIVTVLGMLLGFIGLLLTFAFYCIAAALSGVVIGAYLQQTFTRKKEVSLLWITLGTLCVQALLFVPVFGGVLVLCLFVITLGALVLNIYRRLV